MAFYYYKMMTNFEIVTLQKILFGKGYEWGWNGKTILFDDKQTPMWISINLSEKKLYTIIFDDNVRSISFDSVLDLIESDVI